MDFSSSGGIDLHIHTTASDGTFAPAEILQMALQQGLRAVAITDHDTIEGARLAIQGRIPEALIFLPGVEISCQPPPQFGVGGSLHILGYGIDLDNRSLQAALHQLRQGRRNRVNLIAERLNRLGLNIPLDRIQAEVGQGAAGRPHVAKVMMQMGLVATVEEAFDRYLGKNRPAYVEKMRLDCRLAFDLIHNAGGVPVLAHPGLVKCNSPKGLGELVMFLCGMGLKGIEVYYPKHSSELIAGLLQMAQSYGLLITGGSDFHGEVTPEIEMGKGSGGQRVPFVIYEKLMTAIEHNNGKPF